MRNLYKFYWISLFISTYLYPIDASITMFLQKYPYFKFVNNKKFDATKYSKKLKQPSYVYGKITQPHYHHSGISGVMCLYAGNVALSDANGQILFPRHQQISNIHILIAQAVIPAYMIAPSTIHHWILDQTQAAQNYFVQLKQDEKLDLYYFDVQKVALPKNGNIPLNTIIIIANPDDVVIPTGATITHYSQNIILPPIYIKRNFCFLYNSLYTLSLKQYFAQNVKDFQIENQTISEIIQ